MKTRPPAGGAGAPRAATMGEGETIGGLSGFGDTSGRPDAAEVGAAAAAAESAAAEDVLATEVGVAAAAAAAAAAPADPSLSPPPPPAADAALLGVDDEDEDEVAIGHAPAQDSLTADPPFELEAEEEPWEEPTDTTLDTSLVPAETPSALVAKYRRMIQMRERCLGPDDVSVADMVRHCLCTAFPLPSWLRHCFCIAFPLPSWLRQCLSLRASS